MDSCLDPKIMEQVQNLQIAIKYSLIKALPCYLGKRSVRRVRLNSVDNSYLATGGR